MFQTPDGSPFHLFPANTTKDFLARDFAKAQGVEGEDRAFFVCWTDAVMEAAREWERELPSIRPFFPIKSNNDPILIRSLASLGFGFTAVNTNELHSLLQVPGLGPERLIYANPCKTRSHIRAAASLGVSNFTFDGEEELDRLATLHPNANLLLHITSSSFGCHPGEKAESLLRSAAAKGMSVGGVSFHVENGNRDGVAFEEAIRRSAELIRLGRLLGHTMETLSIGGTFPFRKPKGGEISFSELATVIRRSVESELNGLGVTVIAETAEFFVARAFSLVCNIIATTEPAENQPAQVYINEGVYGSFGCRLVDEGSPEGKPLYLSQMEEEEGAKLAPVPTNVWGSTSGTLDLICDSILLPPMEEGDWMVFEDMGIVSSSSSGHLDGFPPSLTFYAGSLRSIPLVQATLKHISLFQDSLSTSDSSDSALLSDAP